MFGNSKPFGTAATFGSSTFGANSSPFGQTNTFGAKPATSNVFGGTAFGSTTPQTTGLFGNPTPSTGTGLFGQTSTAFGQPASTSGGSFAFGTTPSTGGLFGSTTPATQQNTTGLFGGSSSSAFGSPRPTFGGFGGSTTGTGLFGQTTSTGTGLFGSSTGFATAAAPSGTTITFTPMTSTDTMMKGGVSQNINTRHQCITCMKEYENKSLEELRMEDYAANRKGPSGGISAFGTTPTQTGLFGNPAASTSAFSFGTNQSKLSFGTTAGSNTFGTAGTGLFGQTSQPQNTGMFGKPGGFGVTPTTTTGFAFGTTPGTSLFGQNNQQKPLFGQPVGGTGLFGQPAATSQPSTGFGMGSTFGGFGATPQQSNLFGAKPTGFGTTNTTTTNTFSFGTTGGGLFGGKTTAPTFGTGTGFGATSTGFGGFGNTAGSSTSLFGQNKPTTLGFGTTTNTFGSGLNTGFGANPFSSTGLNTNPGTGLFGASLTNKAPVFGFGNTGATGFSTFAQPTASGTSFNFGAAPGTGITNDPNSNSLLQQQFQARQIFALTNNPYGDNPLFRSTIKDPKRREELLKPTNPAAQKAVLANNQFIVSPLPAAKMKPKPIAPMPNGKVSLFDGLEDEEPSLGNTTFVPKRSIKKLILKSTTCQNNSNLAFTVTSNISSPLTRNEDLKLSTSVLVEKFPSTANNETAQQSSPPSSPLTVDISDQNATEGISSSLRSIESPLSSPHLQDNLYIRKSLSDIRLTSSPITSPDDSIEALHTRNTRLRNFSLQENSETSSHMSEKDTSRVASPDSTLLRDENMNHSNSSKQHPTGIVLHRSGYYTIPSLDDLLSIMDEDGNCFVENFTIGREGYGKVCFLGRINVAGFNLDEIVHFRRKEITVYPDDDNKPPIGQGLNSKAEITLYCVWPTNKTDHSPIKDPDRLSKMGYREKIEKSTARLGAKFLDYQPETGSWVFEVEHFSKYGLQDSDDEGEDVTATKVKAIEPPKKATVVNGTEAVPPTDVAADQQLQKKLRIAAEGGDDDDDEMQGGSGVISESEMFFSPLQQCITSGMDSERIQGMKMSFFLDEVEDNWGNEIEMQESVPRFAAKASDTFVRPIPIKKPVFENFGTYTKGQRPFFDESRSIKIASPRAISNFGRDPIKPARSVLSSHPDFSSARSTSSPSVPFQSHALVALKKPGKERKLTLRPLAQSLVKDKEKLIADMGFFMSRTFRVGWGPDMTYVYPFQTAESEQVNSVTSHSYLNNTSLSKKVSSPPSQSMAIAISRIQVLSDVKVDDIIKVNLEKSLKVQLEHSISAIEDKSPIFVPKPGNDAIHAHAKLMEVQFLDLDPSHMDAPFVKQCYHVWELCIALWGEIPDCDSTIPAYTRQIARREAFSKWLIETTKERIQSEINNNSFKHDSYLTTVFSYLSGRQISKAVHCAQENNDQRMSKLLAEVEGTSFVRRLVAKQLINWQDSEAYKTINYQRLKLYALLGGILFWVCYKTTINVCENLDWRRSLALHLWYNCYPTASIQMAVTEFEKSFMDPDPSCCYTKPPYPPYMEDDIENSEDSDPSSALYDTCFHLIKLYCDRTHRLDKLLMPEMSTPAHLDFRLSWFLYEALLAQGYQHLPADVASRIHLNFASQLETMGLWHWAVFVVLHLPTTERRINCVKDLLLRHLSLDPAKQGDELETFLREQLLVPQEWIFEAKAIRAHSFGLRADEAFYLLKAGAWSKSHQIIIEHLASDAIINENYDYLLNFLKELAPVERSSTIIDWPNGGQVFLDYIHVSQMVESVLKGEVSAYDVEKLQPEVVSLCNRLSSIRCLTAKDRLCQSEMAKKTATLLRAVLTLQEAKSGDASSLYTLAPHSKNLPMPEDYAIQELRALARNYLLAVTSE